MQQNKPLLQEINKSDISNTQSSLTANFTPNYGENEQRNLNVEPYTEQSKSVLKEKENIIHFYHSFKTDIHNSTRRSF